MTQLTAEDILRKEFHQPKSGRYSADEVDEFLDTVTASFRALEDRIVELSAAPTQPEPAPEPQPAPEPPAAPSVPESAAELLALAVAMHDQHIAAGKAEADELVTNARAVAQEQLGDLQATRTELEHKIDELREFEASTRRYVRTQLTDLLSQVPDPDAPDADLAVPAAL